MEYVMSSRWSLMERIGSAFGGLQARGRIEAIHDERRQREHRGAGLSLGMGMTGGFGG